MGIHMHLEPLTTIKFYLLRFEFATCSLEPNSTLANLLEFSKNSQYLVTLKKNTLLRRIGLNKPLID